MKGTDMWVVLSILSAFGQALGWALKKKTLENKGVNNTLGMVSFFAAGVILTILWGVHSGFALPLLTSHFAVAAAVVIGVNILGVWAAYRALGKAALSMLMPLMALTALTVPPIEFALRGVVPHAWQGFGMALVVIGAIIIAERKRSRIDALVTVGYFAVTLLCYSIAPPFMAIAVDASGDALFSAMVFHLGVALGFVPFAIMAKEGAAVRWLQETGEWRRIMLLMIAAGAVIALLENGPATVALETATASEVIALKRTMPFFALILGFLMFKEKIRWRDVIGTALLVAGYVFIAYFH